jgi:thiamine-phosphate pyrophosphorylase
MRGRFRLPQLYPITDTHLSGLSHADQVALFAEHGATVVQLREKRATALESYEQARAAVAIAAQRGVLLIINDRVDIAIAAGATGVHLGQDDLPPEAARRLLGNDAVIGYSTHSVSQALEAARMPIDYLAIGPIFTTSTKENPDPIVGLEGLRAVKAAIGSLPLVAIGGLKPANSAEVLAAGADSVAMISGLWSR